MEQPTRCALCEKETHLYYCDVPICVKCDEPMRKANSEKVLGVREENHPPMALPNEDGEPRISHQSISIEEFANLEVGAMIYLDGDQGNWYTVHLATAGYVSIARDTSVLSFGTPEEIQHFINRFGLV